MAWHFTPCDNENYCIEDRRTPSLRGDVLGADTTGPAVASGYTSLASCSAAQVIPQVCTKAVSKQMYNS